MKILDALGPLRDGTGLMPRRDCWHPTRYLFLDPERTIWLRHGMYRSKWEPKGTDLRATDWSYLTSPA